MRRALCLAWMIGTAGCQSEDGTGPGSAVIAVVVSPATDTLTSFFEVVQLTASALDSAGNEISGIEFTWSAEPGTIVDIDSSGQVTARRNGTTTISAAASNVVGQTVVTVRQEPAQLVFEPPLPNVAEGVPFNPPPQVEVRDANGALVQRDLDSVTIALVPDPGGAVLIGATRTDAPAGIATFHGIAVDRPGIGYRMVATLEAIGPDTSAAFDITPGLRFESLSAGGYHNCGITTAGQVYCWGWNMEDQLGNPAAAQVSEWPVRVSTPPGATFTQVAAGFYHSCALTVTGVAYCWGTGLSGALGNGSAAPRPTPALVTAPPGVSFTRLTAGFSHTCAVATNGDAYCWGSREFGQVGDGTFGATRLVPVLVTGPALDYAMIAGGGNHTCGVSDAGASYCWGSGASGQVGDGAQVDQSTPVAVPVAGGESIASISPGQAHTCAATGAGTAYCWGNGADGEIGDGAGVRRTVPSLVAAPVGVTFTVVTAGGGHSCGRAASGEAFCWGTNSYGQLGDDTDALRFTPAPVLAPGVQFSTIHAGSQHTCGIATGGVAYCWGRNDRGQLGNRSRTDRRLPVRVTAPQ